MMKRLLFLSISLILCHWAIAQAGWILVNSNLANGKGIGQISIGMNNPNALWSEAVNADGSIFDAYTRSTDSGLTWTAGTFNAGTGLSQLFAISADTCWAVFNTGASQGLYKTTDGGATWTKKGGVYGNTSFADAIHFFNNNDGWALGDPLGGYFEMYTTTNGGEAWTRVPQANIPAPTSGEYGITGNYCAIGNNVWFGTNAGRIFRSTDKGLTWAVTLTPFGNLETIAPEFVDALHGIAYRSYLDLGLESNLNVTSDGGVTWTDLAVSGDMYARYFSHIPGSTGTYIGSSSAAGANGISVSLDGGENWNTISSGSNFTATAWINDSTGWAGSIATGKSTGGMYIYDGIPLALPVADFTASDTAIILGGQVTFTNLSQGVLTAYLWTFEGGSPATSTVQNPPPVTYSTPGAFNVSLKVTNAWGDNTLLKVDYIYVGGVGINELSQAFVKIYPNPVKDLLNVEASSNIKEIRIINIVGQTILNQPTDSKTMVINTSDLKSGVYNLKIKLEDGYINKKIVVN